MNLEVKPLILRTQRAGFLDPISIARAAALPQCLFCVQTEMGLIYNTLKTNI